MRRSPRCLSLAVLTALTVAGCGGGSVGGGTSTPPTASAPDATSPPPDAAQPGTGPVTTQTTTPTRTPTRTRAQIPAPSSSPAGGSQSVRIPAAFVTVPGGKLAPATITVPPFLAVELSLLSADGKSHRLVLQTPTPHTLAVGADRRAAIRIAGLRAGRYAVLLDGRHAGALVVGGDGGP